MLTEAAPRLTRPAIIGEWNTCAESPLYFANTYCQIYTPTETGGAWAPFRLWPAQNRVLQTMHTQQLTICLKSRQLGISWLVLVYALYLMLFRPAATISLFSRRQEEAAYLLGPERLRGMYTRLPLWLQARGVTVDSGIEWALSNGSVARAFPTSAGDGYVNTLAVADEYDLVEDQGRLMGAVKPTIDAGGKMVLVSRANKKTPNSLFKRMYRAAKAGQNGWAPVFLPWSARPGRTVAWYEAIKADGMANTGALDDVWEQYPETDIEALAPPSLDKRIPAAWLLRCYTEAPGLDVAGAPAVPDLVIYAPPDPGATYVLGADPAEGNPTSDDSAAVVVDRATGTEVAALVGKLQPEEFAGFCAQLARYYGGAPCLPERNNHGHAFLLAYRTVAPELAVLDGLDGRPGWLTTAPSKALLYDQATELFKAGDAKVRSFATWMQLSSIEGSTLRAPKDEADDRAVAFVLAQTARVRSRDLRPAAVVTGPPRFGPGQYTPPGRGW